jgi:hypothetical protein
MRFALNPSSIPLNKIQRTNIPFPAIAAMRRKSKVLELLFIEILYPVTIITNQ